MIITRTIVSSDTALLLVREAVAHATRNGWQVCAAVVEPTGAPLALLRMDDVPVPVVDFALDKAFTAATLKRASAALFEEARESPALAQGLTNRARLLVWGGGLPLVHEGRVVGGIGVSGVKDFEDIACAMAAIAAAGLGYEV